MYNIRYHIASIVGIFLALAIGLLLGAAIGGSDSMREISNDMIANLRKDYEETLNANAKLTTQADEEQKFASEFVSAWTAGRLAGKHIVILADHDNTAGIDRVRDILERAGAKITLVKIDNAALNALDDASFAKVIEGAGLSDEMHVNTKERTQTLAQLLSYEWLLTQNRDVAIQKQRQQGGILDLLLGKQKTVNKQPKMMKALIDAQVISATSTPEEMEKGFDGVVNMAVDGSGAPSAFSLELCGQLSAYQVPVVLTQIQPHDTVLLKEAQSRGFSGAGRAGTMHGAYSIVALLTGAEKGVYGLDGMPAYPPLPKHSSFDGAGTSEAQAIKESMTTPTSDGQAHTSDQSEAQENSGHTADKSEQTGGNE